jgi:hypothetical protein
MTQRVKRAERRKRRRGFVYRGAHVYRWCAYVRESLALAKKPIVLDRPSAFVEAMNREIYGARVSEVRAYAFELGCYDLLEDVLSVAPPETPPLHGLRVWIPESEVTNG